MNKVDVVEFIKKAHNDVALARVIKTFGNTEKEELTIGSISKLGFGELRIVEKEMPINKSRPGRKMDSVEFIVVHDTGNNNIGANAMMHARFLESDPGVSWHYTVDENGCYHNLPDDEIGFHAGDGLRDFQLIDTKVKATTAKPVITIANGKYIINGIETDILVPVVENNLESLRIADSGIFTIIGENGNYFMNTTYYNKSYKVIANQGGGTRGIGIETCVDEGSSLYSTWQNLAKLVAKLLVENKLGLDRVMQHNNFSGKNCPQALRMSGLWPMFLEMVEFEYELLTSYQDYKFTLIADSDVVDEMGKIINKDITEVNYKIEITNILNGNREVVELVTNLPKK